MILCQIEFIVTRPSSRLWDAAIRDLTKLRRQRQLQKAIGLVSKTTTLHVHHDCLYIFLPSLHNYDLKWQQLKFFWGQERQGDKLYHLCLNSARPPLFSSNINSLLLSSCATWDNREMVGKDAESIWFFSEVFMDVAVVGSQGRCIYFEVVCATGSLFCRTALWDCYGGKISTQFPTQP